MHSVSAQYDALLASDSTHFCNLWTITRRDDRVWRLTDHDTDVTLANQRYRSDIGFTASAVYISATNTANQSVELDIAMTEGGISEADIRGRLFDAALCELWEANYEHPEAGVMKKFKGKFGRIKFTERNHCTVEVLSLAAIDTPIADEVYSQSCRNSLGDSLCKVPIEAFAINIEVTEVLNKTDFKVSSLGSKPADYYALGQLQWLSGDNLSIPVDIRTSLPDTKVVGMFYPLARPVQVGDTGRLYPGCDKQWGGGCKVFGNQVNFRGEPLSSNFV